MRLVLLATMLGLAACGGADPTGNSPDAGVSGTADRFDPWMVGADWTYMSTDPHTGTTATEHTTIEAQEDVPGANAGTTAFRIRTGKITGDVVSWDNFVGDKDVRYAEDDYSTTNTLIDHLDDAPYQLKLDETAPHMTTSAAYSETYTETSTSAGVKSQTRNWTVIATDEMVTVPAGTFSTLHVQRVNPANAKTKDFWFAKGIGKVKEAGEDEDKVLMAYSFPAP